MFPGFLLALPLSSFIYEPLLSAPAVCSLGNEVAPASKCLKDLLLAQVVCGRHNIILHSGRGPKSVSLHEECDPH